MKKEEKENEEWDREWNVFLRKKEKREGRRERANTIGRSLETVKTVF